MTSTLRRSDVLRVAAIGLRTRRLRAALSSVGIAIGIASMVAVLGLSESSRADLVAQLDQLGTDLLTVGPGQDLFGDDTTLPDTAVAQVSRMPTVEVAAGVTIVGGTVRRTDRIAAEETGGISLAATDLTLLRTLGGHVAKGRWLDAALARQPAVVLGAVTARRLGVTRTDGSVLVYAAGRWASVVGILAPLPLAPEVDRSALVGRPAAESVWDASPSPGALYVRADDDGVTETQGLLAATASPAAPESVEVSRPSDVLEAKAAAKGAFTSLFLGLGAVALLVGGVGIANVMVISVLERRSEIGLRRALGATRRDVALQFLGESLLLAGMGGVVGAGLGALVTGGYALGQGWAIVVPPVAVVGGALAALVVGGVAGLLPALRAARLSPTEALRSA